MKTFKFFLAGLFILLPLVPLSAQLDTFDLSSYKLPEIKRKQIDLGLNSQLNSNRNNETQNKNLNFSGNFKIGLSTLTNTEKYQGSQSVSLQVSPNKYTSTRPGAFNYRDDYNDVSNASSVSFTSNNRFFFQDKLYLETNLSGNFINSTSSSTYSNYLSGTFNSKSSYDHTYTDGSITAEIYAGKGRIEPIQDARLAIYILQDLQKLNSLSRIPTHSEIIEFASLLSQLENKRYFDYRLHKIEELTEVTKFLKEKGLLKQDEASSFSVINDNLDYSTGPVRYAGSKVYAGVSPEIGINNTLSHTYNYNNLMALTSYNKSQVNQNIAGLALVAAYEYYKPIKLIWQLHYGITLLYSWETYNTNDKVLSAKNKDQARLLSPIEYISLGYYPNSRTSLSGGINLNQGFYSAYYDGGNSWVKNYSTNTYNATFSLNLTYYISPQLRFNAVYNVGPGWIYDANKQTKYQGSQYLNAGLTYAIF
jgi:hypothetical protein